tara:strand:- start:412 stop:786 length:375 start_codon:yes stop_codon:yes gene_type:complete
MTWVCITIATIFAFEISIRLSVSCAIKQVLRAYQKSVRTIRSSQYSDTVKEKIVILNATMIFCKSVSIALSMAFIILPFLTIVVLGYWVKINIYSALASIPGVFFSALVIGIYFFVRRKIFGSV